MSRPNFEFSSQPDAVKFLPPQLPDVIQAVRDLRWVIDSPLLINNPSCRCFVADSDFDIDASTLLDFLSQRATRRVGHYFEHLVHYYLQHICGFEMLARGLQIQNGKQTVGELDFIFRDHQGVNHHVETAVKFYLYLPESNHTESHFVGPNSADTFERKMKRLFSHQLPLSAKQDITVDTRSAFVKGRIFYRRGEQSVATLPSNLSPSHLRGTWIRSSELDILSDVQRGYTSTCMFKILQKPHWLADDVINHEGLELCNASQMQARLKEHFLSDKRPRLVSVVAESQSAAEPKRSGFWYETERMFVVDENWPLPLTSHKRQI